MAYDAGLIAWVAEAMAPLGIVTHRPMMGAAVLYCDGAVFAVVDEERVWFKADKASDADWDTIGCERFTFSGKDGEVGTLNYRRAPDAIYDDVDELRRLGAMAVSAGLRAPRKPKGARPPRARTPAMRTSRR